MIKIADIISAYIHKKFGIEKELNAKYVDRVIDYYTQTISETKEMVKKGFTLRQLLNKTNAFSTKHADNCKVVSVEMNPRKNAPLFIAKIKCNESYSKGPNTIRVSLSGKVNKVGKKTVKLSCTCNAMRFWGGAWNAKDKKYQYGPDPRKFNGNAPNSKLDTYKYRKSFFVCKHIATFFRKVFTNPKEMEKLTKKKKKAK